MEYASRAMELGTRVLNSQAAINVVLLGAFGVLSARSVHQQQQIEALETEKERLLNSNKAIKKTLWDSKQQLYADASSSSSTVPLSTLKTIYGDVPAPLHSVADADKGDGKSAASKILI